MLGVHTAVLSLSKAAREPSRLMQVEAEAQAAAQSNSLQFLTTTSLPTVGKLESDLLILSSDCIAHGYLGCCPWGNLRFTLRSACSCVGRPRCSFHGERCRGRASTCSASAAHFGRGRT